MSSEEMGHGCHLHPLRAHDHGPLHEPPQVGKTLLHVVAEVDAHHPPAVPR